MSVSKSRCYDAVSGFAVKAAGMSLDAAPAPDGLAGQSVVAQNQAGTNRLSYSLLKAGVVAGGLSLAVSAHALSLGELVIQSGLGQPFLGTVRYTTPRGEDVQPMCIRTRYVQAPPVSGVPELPDPRLEVEPGPGGGTIIIRTSRPVDEPLVRLYLSVNCGPSTVMNREFMVALDPPRIDMPLAQAAPAQPGVSPVLRPRPAAPGARPVAPPVAAGGGEVSGTVAAAVRAEREEQRRLRRARPAGAASSGTPAAGGTVLPYEPGVTPPPGRRGARAQRAAEAQPKYRLTLSGASSDEPDPRPALRSSDALESLNRPNALVISDAQREKLRVESRVRLSEDPVALTLQMQDRLGGLEAGFAELRGQLASIRSEREAAAKRIAQLEEEKRSLSLWLNGMALALGFIGCVAVAALLFWAYRRRVEQNDARARRQMAADAAGFDVKAGANARIEPGLEEEFDNTPWRPEEEAQAIPVVVPAKPAPAPAPRVPATPQFKPTPPGVTPSAPAPAVAAVRTPAVPRIATPAPTPPMAGPPAGDNSYTVTVEIDPKPGKAPPVEDFYANPPRGADESGFSLDEPPAPPPMQAAAMPPVAPTELPAISFELPPGEIGDGTVADGAPSTGQDHGEAIEFSLATGPGVSRAVVPPAPPVAAAAGPAGADDPFGNDPAPPPPPGLVVTLAPPPPSREPTPTLARMKILVDELAAAHLAEVPAPAVSTGMHRTLDIDLGGDGDAEMRAQLYRQEFELKLFPEIVHGQAKLKVPQSIISLARTYYQEDFDTNRAVNLLEYAADRTPDPQRVRLALLEILRMENMAREYIAVSRSFRDQFPSAEEWETVSAYGRLLAPEEPLFKDADVTGYDLNMPSMWLGSTLDMTRYVLAQDLHDAMHGPMAGAAEDA